MDDRNWMNCTYPLEDGSPDGNDCGKYYEMQEICSTSTAISEDLSAVTGCDSETGSIDYEDKNSSKQQGMTPGGDANEATTPTYTPRNREYLEFLFPTPSEPSDSMHGVVPPVFHFDERFPDAGVMPDLLGRCNAVLHPESAEPTQTKAEIVPTDPTSDELRQVMPYLF